LSLGAQSFQPRLLKLLGRIHTADEARAAVEQARAAGFTNLSLDLMHGLPAETRQELSADLDAALVLEPEHLSAYGLTYEEGTPLAAAVTRGEISKLAPEEEAAQYRLVMERLDAGRLAQYEISNYARPGFSARHNLVYWRNEAYLGVGPSAASYAGGERTVNAADLEEWARGIAADGEAFAMRERLSGAKRAREALILELRLRAGVERREFRARWDFDIEAACGAALERFRAQGAMERTDEGRWRIARAGLPVADTILSEFV
jgi:oxygen-independent coproporphyrinogen-3 oxidase